LATAPDSSRRSAASSTKVAGWSTGGVVGVVPADGRNTRFTTVARTLATLWVGCAAFGVADCGVTIALRITGKFFTMDTSGSVEGVLAICGTATVGFSNEVTVDCAFTTTSLIASLPLVVLAEIEADGSRSVKLDRNRFLLGCGVVDVDPLVPDADCGAGVVADRWAPSMSANVFRPVRELPSSPCDVEAAVDPDRVEVLMPPKGPAGVFFTGFESDASLSS